MIQHGLIVLDRYKLDGYQIGSHEVAYWMYLTLERTTEDYREIYKNELTQEEMKRLDDIADVLRNITNHCWWLLK
ncbi:hypothetical protein CON64_09240 [Bacillus pseudomycoides]|nr:hypothetical protein CON64_09240 [Bacillus pseudomycoides]